MKKFVPILCLVALAMLLPSAASAFCPHCYDVHCVNAVFIGNFWYYEQPNQCYSGGGVCYPGGAPSAVNIRYLPLETADSTEPECIAESNPPESSGTLDVSGMGL